MSESPAELAEKAAVQRQPGKANQLFAICFGACLAWAALATLPAWLSSPFGGLAKQYLLSVTRTDAASQQRADSLRQSANSRINSALFLDGANPDWLHTAGALQLIDFFDNTPNYIPGVTTLTGDAKFARASLAQRPGFPATWLLLALHEGEVNANTAALNEHFGRAVPAGLYSRDTRLPAIRFALKNWFSLNPQNRNQAASLIIDSLRVAGGETIGSIRNNGLAMLACGLALTTDELRPAQKQLCPKK